MEIFLTDAESGLLGEETKALGREHYSTKGGVYSRLFSN